MNDPISNKPNSLAASSQYAQSSSNTASSGGDKPEAAAVNPVDLLRDRLEGRWLYAISLSLVFGIVAAIIAWNIAPVNYQAQGWLKGNSRNEVIVEQITESGESNSKDFIPFLESQALLVKSAGVIDHAVNSPELQPLLMTKGRDALLKQLENSLFTKIPNDTEIIVVSFTGPEPEMAATVTNTVMKSYIALHGSQGDERLALKKQQIRQFKQANRLAAESRRGQQQALLRKSKYGLAEISSLASENASAIVALEAQKKAIEETLDKLRKKAEGEGREITGNEIDEPTLAALEEFNPRLVVLKEDIEKIQVDYDKLSDRLSSEHRSLRILDSTLTSMKASLISRVAETKDRWYEGPGKDRSYDHLNKMLQKIGSQMNDKRTEIDEMNALQTAYAALEREIEALDATFKNLDDRLSGIEFEEDALEERIKIAQLAALPSTTRDDKRVQIAAIAFIAGIGGIMGIFFLIGSVDQRAFALRQLQTDKGQFQCLGVVPDTGPTSDDPEALDVAMSCIHRLRNRIESLRGGKQEGRGFVLLISSPFQGDGKTTIATLLGWSYAEAGYRTCLVDCDFIGRSLSHQFGKLHDVGLKEVLKGGGISDHVIPLGNPNLNILPIGLDDTINAEHMPLTAIQSLLGQLRSQYDLIIVDTGPLSGSVESTPIAGAVDGVLLTLRKGRSRLPLRRCVEELRELGAPYLGVVLNYADKSDYRHFSSASKSIDELLREEAAGERVRNPLTDRIANKTGGLGSTGNS